MSTNPVDTLTTLLEASELTVERHHGTGGGCESLLVTGTHRSVAYVLVTNGDYSEPWATLSDDTPNEDYMGAIEVLICAYDNDGEELRTVRLHTSAPQVVATHVVRLAYGTPYTV